MASTPKAHARIIWDCSWSPNSEFFATASRDKVVKIWKITSNGVHDVLSLKFDEAATACSFAPIKEENRFNLAVGLENGQISLVNLKLGGDQLLIEDQKNFTDLHASTVNALKWSSKINSDLSLELASCSDDHSVRLYKVLA
jgi:elongator complex protein 2